MAQTNRRWRRSRCDRCGEQFRHSDPRAKFCGASCRQAARRERQKADAQAERDRIESERQASIAAQAERMAAASEGHSGVVAGDVEEYEHAPAPRAAPVVVREEPLPELKPLGRRRDSWGVWPSSYSDGDDDGPTVTIKNVPTRFPGTPLGRGHR